MNKIIHYTSCPACGSSTIAKELEAKDYTVSQEIFEIWECEDCKLRFTQNIPDKESIGKYYDSPEYISHSNTKKGFVNNVYHKVRNITLKSKRELVQKQSALKKGVLLDIGAGTGAFLNEMKKAGWDVQGIEPDASARKNAKENYNLDLQTEDAFNTIETESIDVITLWHVLEHVHDLHGYINQFMRLLKPKGTLFIAVPNFTSDDAQNYGAHWAAYDVPRHLYHFSPRSMDLLMDNHGFIITAQKPMWFDSFYVSMLSEKYEVGSTNYIKAMLSGLKSNVKATGNTSRCSSIIYVIRKK